MLRYLERANVSKYALFFCNPREPYFWSSYVERGILPGKVMFIVGSIEILIGTRWCVAYILFQLTRCPRREMDVVGS